MTHQEIERLISEGFPPGKDVRPELIETHISYVVLTPRFAYKIKKSLKLSFLDFSTLEKRKYYCEQEVELNRRLTDIYLGVVPIGKENDHLKIGSNKDIIDYAVKMRRLPAGQQMNYLLSNNKIEKRHILLLARQIATFHRNAKIIDHHYDEKAVYEDFADIGTVVGILTKYISPSIHQQIKDWIKLAETTLRYTRNRFKERVVEGFIKDGHGDLHSGNIFIHNEPVIFDCIEFSPHLRQNDVLSELAFLAMDLEFHGHEELQKILVENYQKYYPCFLYPADEVIFQYYLLYRANVRLKVTTIALQEQLKEGEAIEETLKKIKSFIGLCQKYAAKLSVMLEDSKVQHQ